MQRLLILLFSWIAAITCFAEPAMGKNPSKLTASDPPYGNFFNITDDQGVYYGAQWDYNRRDYFVTVHCLESYCKNIIIPASIGHNGQHYDSESQGYKITSIAEEAFRYSYNAEYNPYPYTGVIESITIKCPVSIGSKAFRNLPNLKVLDLGPCTYTSTSMCEGCPQLTTVKSNGSLTYIGESSFKECSALTTITGFDNVTTINKEAFYRCNNIEVFPSLPKLKTIGEKAFYHCYSLTVFRLTTKDTWDVENIGKEAFSYCSSLTTLPKFSKPVNIAEQAFLCCSRLECVDCAPSYIGKEAFNSCTSLKTISSSIGVTSNCESIGENAFSSLTCFQRLESITGTSILYDHAFAGCESLISFSGSIQLEGNNVFDGCKSLESASIVGEKIPDFSFRDCISLRINLPSTIKEIGKYAFSNCISNQQYNIPDGVYTLSEGTFYGNTFEDIELPSTIGTIGEKCFGDCSNLRALTVRAHQPPKCAANSFENVYTQDCELNIPKSSIRSYLNDPIWRKFNIDYVRATSLKIILPESNNKIFDVDNEHYILRNMTATLQLSVTPEDALFKEANWSADNNNLSIISLSNNTANIQIRAAACGTSIITAETVDQTEVSDNLELKIVDRTTGISIDQEVIYLHLGEKFTISPRINPLTALQKVKVTADNPEVVLIDGYTITGNALGECNISITGFDGSSAQANCHVIVYETEAIIFDQASITLTPGESQLLNVNFQPNYATESLKWSSTNENIAQVINGQVYARSLGECEVIATTENGLMASCKVYVNPKLAERVVLNKEDLTLSIGETEILTATVLPDDTTDKTVVWTSSAPSIVTVDSNGEVKAIGVGKATITATCGDIAAICSITVNPIVAESIVLNKANLTLSIGETEILTAMVLPDDTTDKTVVWTSSDPSVVTVDNQGCVKAVSVGSAVITAVCGDVSADCNIEIVYAETDDILLADDSELGDIFSDGLNMYVGDVVKLDLKVVPSNASQMITFRSTDDNVGIIDEDGSITAVAEGECRIFMKSGGLEKCFTLFVSRIAQTIVWEQEIGTLEVGDVVELSAVATSGLDVEYTVILGDCTVANSRLNVNSPGEIILQAYQPGNEQYLPAEPIQRTFNAINGLDIIFPDSSTVRLEGDELIIDSGNYALYDIKGHCLLQGSNPIRVPLKVDSIYILKLENSITKFIIR